MESLVAVFAQLRRRRVRAHQGLRREGTLLRGRGGEAGQDLQHARVSGRGRLPLLQVAAVRAVRRRALQGQYLDKS